MREGFLIYKGFYKPIKHLPLELKGMLLDAIFEYQINGIEPTEDSPIFIPFSFFQNQFRVDNSKYEGIVKRNRANGLKGGRPKNPEKPKKPSGLFGNPKNPEKPKESHKDKDKEKDKEIDEVYKLYLEKINSNSKLTSAARDKINSRLKTYKKTELLTAIDNFANSEWWMENNSSRGVAWFFHSDDRTDQFINLRTQKPPIKKYV